MQTSVYNRLQAAAKRYQALDLSHVTITVPLDKVLGVQVDLTEHVADHMEKQAAYMEASDKGECGANEYGI